MTNSDPTDKKLRGLIDDIRSARDNPEKLLKLLDRYEKDFGPLKNERVLEIIGENTRRVWAEIASEQENNDIDGILDTLWKAFKDVGGEFTVERTEKAAQIECTKCPMADTYHQIGKQGYGLIFHCSTDPHIVAGFNPEMKFKISKTLMNGDKCCNHYYELT